MKSDDDREVTELSEVYDVLRSDAKAIVEDLRGGVTMWREAAGADVAAAGFILILALTTLHYGPSGTEGWFLIAAQLVLAAVLIAFAVFGFRKYFALTKKYKGLFERATTLK